MGRPGKRRTRDGGRGFLDDVSAIFMSHRLSDVAVWMLLGAGVVVALPAAYLALLALASLRLRARDSESPSDDRLPRITVLVPAHDEEYFIGSCVDALKMQRYPAGRYDIVVVADNCSDSTAAIAADRGARVLVRSDAEHLGKGYALRWAMDEVLTDPDAPDAVAIVDADSVADEGLLSGLATRFIGGAEAVQAEYLALVEGDASASAEVRALAFVLFHRVRFAGRSVLGLPCSLVGNGMLLSRTLLMAHPWDAFGPTEDLEYSTRLRLWGVKPVFAPEARIEGPIEAGGSGADIQRRRWEGGRLQVVGRYLPEMLRAIVARGRLSLVDAALDLATPPLGALATLLLLGSALASLLAGLTAGNAVVVVPWLTALVALAVFCAVGLRSSGVSTGHVLAAVPATLAGDLRRRLRLLAGGVPRTWERTQRPASAATVADVAPRVDIAGVPIDRVRAAQAVRIVLEAVEARTFLQVCTVNLDFLVNARRNRAVASLLQHSALNLADGMPVVWLGRLLGQRLDERVAGADFVPALVSQAAHEGASVFLLGGENGVARRAADRLTAENPGLRLAGVYEPSVASVDQLEDDEILRRLRQAHPDILLVALGHPKQDLWIRAHRDELPVSVAIGVGCTFDLLAGRKRAPSWMRRSGMEWFYRLTQERRLLRRYATDATWLVFVLAPMTISRRLGRG